LVELVACQRPADVARVVVKAWVAVVAAAEQARAVDVQVVVAAAVAEVSNDDVCTNP
jgi:hypothetical protein